MSSSSARVRLIYDRYLSLGSIGDLAAELDRQGIRSKRRMLADGTAYGARPFSKGALAHLLKNRVYVGEVIHKEASYPGEHQPIVDRAIWDRVQDMLDKGRSSHRQAKRAEHLSPLAGMISDGEGRAMTPSHATKGSRRYRYYVTAPDTPAGRTPADGWRIPAGEIEELVRTRLAAFLTDEATLIGHVSATVPQEQLQPLLGVWRIAAARLADPVPAELRATLSLLDARVRIAPDQIEIILSLAALRDGADPDSCRCSIIVPATITRRGHELRLAYPANDRDAPAAPDVKLLGLLAKADAASRELIEASYMPTTRRAHLVRLARLKYLAPDIVKAILDGRQPVQLTARRLLRATEIPVAWNEQRVALGFL